MNKYDNSGKGALWANEYWTEGSKAPKWTGKIVADRDIAAGEEFKLAAWPADRKKDSSPEMRLQIDRFEKKQQAAPEPKKDFDDKIPFMWGALIPVSLALVFALTLLAPSDAVAQSQHCASRFDPMGNRWVYVCGPATPIGQPPAPPPTCRSKFDAMSGKWVYVCSDGSVH